MRVLFVKLKFIIENYFSNLYDFRQLNIWNVHNMMKISKFHLKALVTMFLLLVYTS